MTDDLYLMKENLLLIISIGLPKGRELLLGLLLFFRALLRWGLENFAGEERYALSSILEFSPPF